MKRKHTRFVKDQLTTNFKRTYPLVLLIILAFFALQFLVTVFSTGSPNVLNSGIFYQLFGNSFADFFSANQSLTFFDPYASGSSLPALNFVFALPFMVMQCVSEGLALSMYLIVEFLMLVILVMATKQKLNLSVKSTVCLSIVCLLSAPFLFLIERGSYLFFTLFFVAVFFLCKDSERKWLREIAVISLAVASAMQIYTIVFAIFLLKEKRFAEAIRFAIYTVVLFFLPFVMFKGGMFENIGLFFANMGQYIASDSLSSDVSFTNLFRMFAYILGLDYLNPIYNVIILILNIGLSLCLVVSLFGSREKWKTLAMCALLCVVLPHPAMESSLVFLLLAFIAFLQQPKFEEIDIFYVVLFTLIFIPYQFGYIIWPTTFPAQYSGISAFDPNYLGLTINVLISALAAATFAIALVCDAIKKMPKRHISLKEYKMEDVEEDED